ncbi:hypothetical protein J6590_063909 [Homalodisca vitripennis]|nr:hypothetical protein J6590_063909 [Homalodisca vitripennis]
MYARQRAIFVSSVTVTIGELENRFSPKGVYPAHLFVPVRATVNILKTFFEKMSICIVCKKSAVGSNSRDAGPKSRQKLLGICEKEEDKETLRNSSNKVRVHLKCYISLGVTILAHLHASITTRFQVLLGTIRDHAAPHSHDRTMSLVTVIIAPTRSSQQKDDGV